MATTDRLYLLPRLEGGALTAAAQVSVWVESTDLRSHEEVLAALRRAVTAWVMGCHEGQALWIRSQGLLSIEDLALHDLVGFQPYLASVGIRSLDAKLVGWDCLGDYDAPLVESDRLPADLRAAG